MTLKDWCNLYGIWRILSDLDLQKLLNDCDLAIFSKLQKVKTAVTYLKLQMRHYEFKSPLSLPSVQLDKWWQYVPCYPILVLYNT